MDYLNLLLLLNHRRRNRNLVGLHQAVDELLLDLGLDPLLGGGFESRLNLNLREDKSWSYGAGSFLVEAAAQRPWLAYAPVQSDRTADSMTEMYKEIVQIRGEVPPTDAELAKIKDQRTLTLPGRWQTNGAVVGDLAEIVRFDLPDELKAFCKHDRATRVAHSYGKAFRDIVRALANALDGPAKIPHFTQDFTIDLSVFFGEGRALSQDVRWFQMESSTTGADGAAGTSTWSVTDEAVQTYFLDGVFEPPMRVDRTYEAQLEKGLFLIALDRPLDAASALTILLEVEPLSSPPYDPALIKAFHSLRLKSAVFGAQALTAAGQSEKALALLPDDPALLLGAAVVGFASGDRPRCWERLDAALRHAEDPKGLLARNADNTMGAMLGVRGRDLGKRVAEELDRA